MAELGTKHECYSCGAKFYDFGRPAPICPKCGANQKDVKRSDSAAESQAKRKRRDEVPKVVAEPEDDLAPAADLDIPDDEIETPEGVVEEEDDFDDDEE
ncbi:MAG: TIGR02300 family protein [Thermoanaerobaculia bacterium]